MLYFFVAENCEKRFKKTTQVFALVQQGLGWKDFFFELSFGVDPISQQKGSLVENCRRQNTERKKRSFITMRLEKESS